MLTINRLFLYILFCVSFCVLIINYVFVCDKNYFITRNKLKKIKEHYTKIIQFQENATRNEKNEAIFEVRWSNFRSDEAIFEVMKQFSKKWSNFRSHCNIFVQNIRRGIIHSDTPRLGRTPAYPLSTPDVEHISLLHVLNK